MNGTPPSQLSGQRRIPGTPVVVLSTTTGHGDQRLLGTPRGTLPPGVPPGPVLTANQVHGAMVLVDPALAANDPGPAEASAPALAASDSGPASAGAPGPAAGGPVLAEACGDPRLARVRTPWAWWAAPEGMLPDGDALVSGVEGRAVAVLTADCLPMALATPSGIFAAVHVGWRGLVGGIVEAAAAVVGALGGSPPLAVLGPTIGPCCYEFSAGDLASVLACTGGVGRSTTVAGRPALDLAAGVRAAAARCGVEVVGAGGPCTACGGEHFSHRARRQRERQATVAWREP